MAKFLLQNQEMTTTVETGALEMLDANLDTISNELNCLVLGNDLHESEDYQIYPGTNSGYTVDIGTDALMYWNQYQELKEAATQFTPYALEPMIGSASAAATTIIPLYGTHNYAGSSIPMNVSYSAYGENNPIAAATCAAAAAAAVGTPPKFEFHYLRSQSFNKSVPNAEPVPLISTATAAMEHQQQHYYQQQRHQRCGQGAYKKYNNYHHHHNKYNNNKQQKSEFLREEVNDDNFVVDLEKIGIPTDGLVKLFKRNLSSNVNFVFNSFFFFYF